MNLLEFLKRLRDDIKTWVTNNLNALNAKIDEKTIPIDSELSSTSTNPVQNKTIAKEIDSINDRVGNTPVAIQISNAIDKVPTFSGDYNDLTNAPDISEDGSGNMVIADESGNIIFKADADGIHTTAVSLNGEAAATEKYVDDVVANIPTPDVSGQINAHNTSGEAHADIRQAIENAKEELSESIVAESDEWKVVDEAGNIIFSVDATGAHTTELTLNGENAATESYVDNAIENIEFPTTDLTNYATKKYVDDAVDGIEIPSLDGYATETYVDNKVADLVNSAPEALNTLGELAEALENHEDAYDALLETVGGKATHTDLENLKEELSESIVSETDEWKVVDNDGNIIFSVDADGAHTTSMTLNGQSVEDMIDDKIGKFEESDPTVHAWAKEPTKPSYTAEEVHALADTTILADLAEDTTHRTVTDEEKAFWNNKVDSVEGKQLSTNDFTNEYKTKLDNINSGGIVSEEDPTVPAWAKEPTKPSYTADEVGALPDTTTLSDLTDNAITEDESKEFIISDSQGNIVCRVDKNGIDAINFLINGRGLKEQIEEWFFGSDSMFIINANEADDDPYSKIITENNSAGGQTAIIS